MVLLHVAAARVSKIKVSPSLADLADIENTMLLLIHSAIQVDQGETVTNKTAE
jgi:hypothetical protein